jgi:DNA-binding SARP family transcriptional activator
MEKEDMQLPQYRLYCLGAPRLETGHRTVKMDTRKATALLVYLVVNGEVQARDTMAALLWPEFDQKHARAALRRTLSTLKNAVSPGMLQIDGELVSIASGAPLWVDVNRFHELSASPGQGSSTAPETHDDCLERLAEAAALYKGDFLAGFTLRDSIPFDEWQFYQTENLHHALADVLEELTLGYAALGEYHTALEYAYRQLNLDPLRESAHQELMRLYTWSGDRNAALRQYRDAVRVLDKELGVPPLEETTQLYQAILDSDLPAPEVETALVSPRKLQPAASHKSTQAGNAVHNITPPLRYPLVGRSTELDFLQDIYKTEAPHGYFVLLEGEAGVGKTRLAEELLAFARRLGGVVLSARCYQGETNLAYSPFIEAL